MTSKNVFSTLIFITFLVMIVFGILQHLQIPKGTLIDWILGTAAAWWLLIIVVLPWNMHFEAKEVLDQVNLSQQKELAINELDVQYVEKISRRYLGIALALHLISAVGLAILAYLEISPIGYWGAILALLLMGLRPAIRLHAYIIQRLQLIRQEVLYPREDAYELRLITSDLKMRLESIEYQLNANYADTFAASQQQETKALKNTLQNLQKRIESIDMQNQLDHEKLHKKSEDTLAKLSEDAQFLGQVRDLIRFIKNA
ncbi:MAG: hypothetical protein ACKVTZ_01230 [Bacteroidia bacterium]